MKNWILLATIFTGFVSGNGSLRTAMTHYEKEAYAQSILAYREALTHYPEISTQIYYNIGICFLKMDSVAKAVNYFQRSIQGEDGKAASMAANDLGVILTDFYREKEALRNFKKALTLDPSNEHARFNYEMLRRKLGDQEKDDPDPEEEEYPGSSQSLSEEELLQLLEGINKYRNMASGKDFFAPQSLDSIPLPIARRLLEEKRRSETQFIQQLKKAPIQVDSRKKGPDW